MKKDRQTVGQTEISETPNWACKLALQQQQRQQHYQKWHICCQRKQAPEMHLQTNRQTAPFGAIFAGFVVQSPPLSPFMLVESSSSPSSSEQSKISTNTASTETTRTARISTTATAAEWNSKIFCWSGQKAAQQPNLLPVRMLLSLAPLI